MDTIEVSLLNAISEFVHGDGEVSMELLAQKSGYSLRHFHRLVTDLTNESPMALCRRVRIERAAHQLRNSRLPVGEIALQAGFQSPEAFARAFRNRYGRSPSEFRVSHGAYPLLASNNGIHWDTASPKWANFNNGKLMITPKIIPFSTKRFAYRVHTGVEPDIASTWATINSDVAKVGLDRSVVRSFTLSLSPPETPPDQELFHCGISVPERTPIPEGFEISELPGGTYAVFIHQGPDDLIVDTWSRAFAEWLPNSGREFDCVCFEEYINGFYTRPEKPDERLIATAVYLKLKD